MELPIGTVNCAFCGQCTVVCPVGALKETDSIQAVWAAINDKNKRVVVQTALRFVLRSARSSAANRRAGNRKLARLCGGSVLTTCSTRTLPPI